MLQFEIRKEITSSQLSELLNLPLVGDNSLLIEKVGTLSTEGRNVLKFSNKVSEDFYDGVLIAPKGSKAESLIISDKPRLDFCRALEELISNDVLIKNCNKSVIDESCHIASSVIIEDNVTIGKNTVVEHNVTIHSGVTIGENCIIRANSVIGSQGFGFEQNYDGTWIRFPHLGGLVIGDNVEIGALNSLCIGALGNTVISNGVKTDNLVHIAHNCIIGKNSILTACTELSGGVELGEGVWMGPNSSTKQKIKIDDGALVGLASVVTKNVEKDKVVAGFPAKVLR